MKKSVTDPQITNVLILLDPMYEKRSNERKGGSRCYVQMNER